MQTDFQLTLDKSHEKEIISLTEKLTGITVTHKEAEELLKTIQTKFDIQTQVNSLFLSPALNGNTVQEKIIVIDTLEQKAFTEQKESLYQTAEKLDEWQASINLILNTAETQLAQNEKVKALAEKQLKDKKLTKETTAENIKALQTEIEKVKNETLKKQYTEQLKTIQKLAEDKESKDEKKSSQEKETKKEEPNKVQQSNGTINSGNGGGSDYVAPKKPEYVPPKEPAKETPKEPEYVPEKPKEPVKEETIPVEPQQPDPEPPAQQETPKETPEEYAKRNEEGMKEKFGEDHGFYDDDWSDIL